jgi:hypothetical protein
LENWEKTSVPHIVILGTGMAGFDETKLGGKATVQAKISKINQNRFLHGTEDFLEVDGNEPTNDLKERTIREGSREFITCQHGPECVFVHQAGRPA